MGQGQLQPTRASWVQKAKSKGQRVGRQHSRSATSTDDCNEACTIDITMNSKGSMYVCAKSTRVCTVNVRRHVKHLAVRPFFWPARGGSPRSTLAFPGDAFVASLFCPPLRRCDCSCWHSLKKRRTNPIKAERVKVRGCEIVLWISYSVKRVIRSASQK